jgi:hypothetical protein
MDHEQFDAEEDEPVEDGSASADADGRGFVVGFEGAR